jgi:DNA polymerase/3'-5' exonuclease PolX
LQGIGQRIAGKIDELLATGHIHKLDEIRGDEVNKAVNELAQVPGIGIQISLFLIGTGTYCIYNIGT